MHLLDYEPDDIDVRVAELIMATTDAADPLLHPKIQEALHILREHMDMDVVFVSQFKEGRRTFKVVDLNSRHTMVQAGQSDPIEESWCKHVVDGRLPELVKDARPFVDAGTVPKPGMEIGTHLSTPVVLNNGEVYGTLCCFSSQVKDKVGQLDLQRLKATARLLATDLLKDGMGQDFELQPLPDTNFKKAR